MEKLFKKPQYAQLVFDELMVITAIVETPKTATNDTHQISIDKIEQSARRTIKAMAREH